MPGSGRYELRGVITRDEWIRASQALPAGVGAAARR
jgi:hypothetical protein